MKRTIVKLNNVCPDTGLTRYVWVSRLLELEVSNEIHLITLPELRKYVSGSVENNDLVEDVIFPFGSLREVELKATLNTPIRVTTGQIIKPDNPNWEKVQWEGEAGRSNIVDGVTDGVWIMSEYNYINFLLDNGKATIDDLKTSAVLRAEADNRYYIKNIRF